MDYLTATEFSKKWSITSRMVARYCETGRIVGAHIKGKTWLIPASAEKPLDQRCKKQTVKTIVPAGGSLESSGEAETYHTNISLNKVNIALANLNEMRGNGVPGINLSVGLDQNILSHVCVKLHQDAPSKYSSRQTPREWICSASSCPT